MGRNVVEMNAPDRACGTSWDMKTEGEKNRVCDPGAFATSVDRDGADRAANLPRCNIGRKRTVGNAVNTGRGFPDRFYCPTSKVW